MRKIKIKLARAFYLVTRLCPRCASPNLYDVRPCQVCK